MKRFIVSTLALTASFAPACIGPANLGEPSETSTTEDTGPPPGQPPIALGHIVPVEAGPPMGYLPGESRVSTSGGYEYTLTLDAPRGRAGMEPHLALAYSSGGGVGSVGAGWSVAGAMSIIRPCAPTMATDHQVGFPTRFCLDQQRLMRIGNTSEFRTENDSFAKIVSQPAGSWPTSWTVHLDDGRIRKYMPVKYDGVNTRFWALASEEDRRGNTVRYHYDHHEHWETCTSAEKADPDGHPECKSPYTHFSFEIDRIEYTTRGDEQPLRKVTFQYAPHPPQMPRTYLRLWDDAKQKYDFRDVSRLLGSIQMHGPDETGIQTLAWSYGLTYTTSPDTGRPLLASVKKCSASGGCLLARELSYSERSPGSPHHYYELWEQTRSEPIAMEQVRVFDADGDGKDDVYLWLGPDANAVYRDAQLPVFNLGDQSVLPDGIAVDVDGDGRVELVASRFLPASADLPDRLEKWIFRFDTDAHATPWMKLPETPPLWENDPNGSGYSVPPLYSEIHPILFGDRDGDGLPDLCRGRPGWLLDPASANIKLRWLCAPNQGVDTATGAWLGFGAFVFVKDSMDGDEVDYLADLDGDGREEFRQGNVLIGDAQGDGLLEELDLNAGVNAANIPIGERFTVGDFDGDGRHDVVDDSTLTVEYAHTTPGTEEPSAHAPAAATSVFRGDFDADGRDDMLLVWVDDGITHMKAIAMAGAEPDRLVEVRDEGADWRERITYSRKVAPDWNGQQCDNEIGYYGNRYPNTCVRRGFSVVSRIESRTGTPRDRQFNYQFPHQDRHGRGFLGFAYTLEWQPDRPALLVTWTDNLTGMGGVYPGTHRPQRTLEIVPIVEQTAPGAAIQQVGSATARIARVERKYKLTTNPAVGTFSVVPDPASSWSSEEWEQPVDIDWVSWPHVDVGQTSGVPSWPWSNLMVVLANGNPTVPFVKKREGKLQLDDYGNVTSSEERTLPGPHPTLGSLGGTRRTTAVTYEYRPADWLMSLATEVKITDEASDGSTTTRTTRHEHDPYGQVQLILREPDGGPEERQDISLTRNADGLITDVIATAGGKVRAEHMAYDSERVYPVETWNDYGHASWLLWHPTLGVRMVAVDPNGVTDDWIHDDLGRLRHTLRQGHGSTTTTHEPWTDGGLVRGTIVRLSGEDGAESETWLDDRGRTTSLRSTDFAGQWRSASVERDLLGRVSHEQRPHQGATAPSTRFRYDSLDRVVETILPDDSSRTSTHGFFEVAHHDALQHEERLSYDFDDRVVRIRRTAQPLPWDAGSILETSIAYAPFGQVETVTDPGNNQTHMFYDHRGRRWKTVDPDSGETYVVYNGHGEVEAKQTAAAGWSYYALDDIGRVTKVTTQDGVGELVWDIGPHGLGKLASTRSADGTEVEYTYDADGRVQDEAWVINGMVDPFVISRAYDGIGRLQTLRYPAAADLERTAIDYAYNPHGYLERVTDISPTIGSSVLWTIDARNEEDSLLEAHGGDWVTKLGYEELSGRLFHVEVAEAISTHPILDTTYKYDQNGSVSAREDSVTGRRETFHMDGHRRLKEWILEYGLADGAGETRTSIYEYDAIDNIHHVEVSGSAIASYKEAFSYGSGGRPHALHNRSLPLDPQTFFHDAQGRLLDGDGRQYSYTSVDLPRTITTPAGTTTFDYDLLGARARKTGPNGTTISIGRLYELREEVGGMSHVFVVPSPDGPVAEIVYRPADDEARTVHYLHRDALGSVSATTSQIGGATYLHYEPFGLRIKADGAPASGSVDDVRHGFTGHHHDDDLGLIDMRGRIYDPSTRRFLTPDPLVRPAENPYSYVSNDPLNLVDPSGFSPEKPANAWLDSYAFGTIDDNLQGTTDSTGGVPDDLLAQIIDAQADIHFSKGNDAPSSAGCPTGTGTAPRPCSAPSQAGCPSGSSHPVPETEEPPPRPTLNGADDLWIKAEEAYTHACPLGDDCYRVTLHGGPGRLTLAGGARMESSVAAYWIRTSDGFNWHGKKPDSLWLTSCNGAVGGINSIAAQLSRALHIPVIAAEGYVLPFDIARRSTCDENRCSWGSTHDPNQPLLDKAREYLFGDRARWVVFYPNGRIEPIEPIVTPPLPVERPGRRW